MSKETNFHGLEGVLAAPPPYSILLSPSLNLIASFSSPELEHVSVPSWPKLK